MKMDPDPLAGNGYLLLAWSGKLRPGAVRPDEMLIIICTTTAA